MRISFFTQSRRVWPKFSENILANRTIPDRDVIRISHIERAGLGIAGVGIAGIGYYLPERILTNAMLSDKVDIADDWIQTRTGIRERHIAADEQATSDLGAAAGRKAMQNAGVTAEEIDLVIVATGTADMQFPSTSCIIQDLLQLNNAAAFDVTAGCTGFIYALAVGSQFVASGFYQTVLVIGAEVISRIVDWEDPETCILFGDGAGAVVLQAATPGYGLLSAKLGANGAGGRHLLMPAGGSRLPNTPQTLAEKLNKLKMNGQEVFRFAVKTLPKVTLQALEAARLSIEDVSLIIPHQANQHIIEAAARRLDLPLEKFMLNIDRYGNMSAASVPVALCEAVEAGRVKHNDVVVMTAFGAGLTWGSVVLRWKDPT